MNPRTMQALTITLLFLSILSSTAYTIRETQRGVLIQFGEIIDADLKPGLGFKLPMIHEIRKFDARTQVTDSERTEYLTQENKFLIVDSYVLWKVADVKKYFTVTSGDASKAELLLLARVKDSLKNKVSERTVHEVVAGQRDQMMVQLRKKPTRLRAKSLVFKWWMCVSNGLIFLKRFLSLFIIVCVLSASVKRVNTVRRVMN